MSYENGMSYTATISEISTYPLEGSYYNGTGNPNSSTYEFTAVVDNPEGLSNGMYLDITLSTSGNVSVDGSSDALYLDKAYIREDEGGSYVMKSGIDNRLYKQYLELGATIYSGNYVEIISGLTVDDYIAFPYGTDVKEACGWWWKAPVSPPWRRTPAAAPPAWWKTARKAPRAQRAPKAAWRPTAATGLCSSRRRATPRARTL